MKGKNAHDARLVAAMVRHGLTHILTFNAQDFSRYRGITIDDARCAPAGRSLRQDMTRVAASHQRREPIPSGRGVKCGSERMPVTW